MNVLLISFSFPPAGGVGVLRALSLAKYLPSEGVRVDVLTARNAPAVGRDQGLLAQVSDSVTVHRTWTLDLPFALRKKVKKLLGGSKRHDSATQPMPATHPAAPRASSASAGMQTRGNVLRRFVANLLLPDPQIGWLPFALPAARRIIRKREIDAVLITVPPFSSAALVTRLRRSFPSLPIVLDFRDEWLSTTLDLVSYNNNQRAREVAQRTESEAVRDASRVVLVTAAAERELAARYPQEPRSKFICIENGYDREPVAFADAPRFAAGDISQAHPGTEPAPSSALPILFTYTGTVYGSTDPRTLIAAVKQLAPELRGLLRLRFIGHVERPADRAALESLGSMVELRAFVPQAEALRAMADTDWLLLVTHDRINVAAKFYDYLAGGKPIFAAVHPEGDVRRLLEETGAGVWADSRDPEAIGRLLTSVLRGDTAEATLPSRRPEQIARFHRKALAHRYAEALRELAEAAPSRSPAAEPLGSVGGSSAPSVPGTVVAPIPQSSAEPRT